MRSQELNLLVIFDAIMTEVSITRAGKQLNMTQPAVSNAVARMRHIWKDDLFIKDGRTIAPTAYAERLWEGVRPALEQIRSVLEPTAFDPTSSERAFQAAAVDSVAGLIWPQLRQIIEDEAPRISIHTFPYTLSNGERTLDSGKVDVLIAAANLMPPLITSQHLYDAKYLCVMRADHPLAKRRLTTRNYANAEHLLVAPSGNPQGYGDQALTELGLTRRIGLSVNGFSSVPDILKHSNLICTLPSIFVERGLLEGSLVAKLPPVKIPSTRICIFWHKRSEKDGGIAWLRNKIETVLKDRMAKHGAHMSALLD